LDGSVLPATADVNSLGQYLLNPLAAQFAHITPAGLDAIRLSLSNSITYMFLIGAVIVLCALVTSVFVKSVPLKSADQYHEREEKSNEPSRE